MLEELVDRVGIGGGYFDLGSATFNLTRIATGQLDAYVDVGPPHRRRAPGPADRFLEVGDGSVCTNFPYDVAAGALIVEEAGGVITHADGRSLADHPAVGSLREHGLAVLAAGGRPSCTRRSSGRSTEEWGGSDDWFGHAAAPTLDAVDPSGYDNPVLPDQERES